MSRLLCFTRLSITMTLFIVGVHASAMADEDQQVEAYLSRLGLVDLQLLQMNKRLAVTSDRAAKQRLAKTMADLYANQLMTHAESPAKYSRLLSNVKSLLAEHPTARTTSIEVMLLQADYNRAESLAGRWIDDKTETQALTDARGIFNAITPKLVGHHAALVEQIDAIDEELNAMAKGEELDAKTRELQRVEAVAARAQYFTGWSSYYQGIVQESAPDSTQFSQAEKFFREFIGVDGKKLSLEDADLMGLDVIWRARAMIGLGLTLAAQDNLDEARVAFALLEQTNVPPQIQQQAAYWYVRGLLNAGHAGAAIEYAREQIRRFSGKPTQGRMSMCVALVRGAFSGNRDDADRRGMIDVGMSGLSRLNQPGVIRQLMEKYEIPIDESSGFILRAVRGKQLFTVAEASKKSSDYEAARTMLASALETPGAEDDVQGSADVTYQLAWCCFRLKQYEEAGGHFEAAARAFNALQSDAAVDTAWMAFVSYQQIKKDSPRFATAAVRVLEGIKRDYPNHKYALKADYYISKLMQNASPEEAMKSLAKVKPTDANYLNARYDLCGLLHRAWSSAKMDTTKRQYASELRDAADVYLQAATDDKDDSRKLRIALYVVDVTTNEQSDVARTYLSKAEALANGLPPQNSSVVEFHYRTMQMAATDEDDAKKLEHARWIVANGSGSPYEVVALVAVARVVDATVKRSPSNEQALQDAHRTYDRLSQRLGQSADVLKAQKNAKVAASKSAYYAERLGLHRAAAPLLRQLVTAFPSDQGYLRRAGLAYVAIGNYADALSYWRTLTKGIKRSSDEWHEAKYYQIACLAETDASLAKKVFDQYKVLYPNLGPPSIRSRFAKLSARL